MNAYPRRVAIDTQILIYSLKQETGDPDEDDFTLRSKELIRDLLKADSRIVMSMITLAEFLVKTPEPRRFQTAQQLGANYELVPFGIRAAVIASGLVPFGKQLVSGDRDVIMADTKIIASIAAAGCQHIYTHDLGSKFSQISAHAGLQVHGLPSQMLLPFQTPSTNSQNQAATDNNDESDSNTQSASGE